jgi:sugar phosphate isomerase/epimerase
MKCIALIFTLVLLHFNSAAQDIGIQLYSFREQFPKDVDGTLKRISIMGFTKLEGGSTYGLSVAEFKELLDKNKMKMISISGDFEKLENDIYSIIGDAKTYGAKYIMCSWIPHKNNEFTIDDARHAVDVFNKAGKLLREKGLTLCYHIHGYEFRPYESGTLFDYMATRMNPAYANFEMDVFWVKHPGQEPTELMKKYPGRFILMHLKDRKPGTPGTQDGHADVESNVVLGQGDVGIAEIMKVAKKSGVKQFFIEDESSRSFEQVPLSLAYLKGLKK